MLFLDGWRAEVTEVPQTTTEGTQVGRCHKTGKDTKPRETMMMMQRWNKPHDISCAKDKSLVLTITGSIAADADQQQLSMMRPVKGDEVLISYELRGGANGAVMLDQRTQVRFRMGEQSVPPALERAVSAMYVHECGVLDIAHSVAETELRPPSPNELNFAEWGGDDNDDDKFTKANDIVARMFITLHALHRLPHVTELSPAGQIEHALMFKERAGQLFGQQRYKQAKRALKSAVAYLERQPNATAEEHERANEIVLACQLNIAACALKLNRNAAALEACDAALAIDPRNIKALFRRALACIQLCQWDEADSALRAAVAIDPNNAAVREEIRRMGVRRREHADKERAMFVSLFDRLVEHNAKERMCRIRG